MTTDELRAYEWWQQTVAAAELAGLRAAFGPVTPENLADRLALVTYNCKGRLITYAELSYLVAEMAAVAYQDDGEPELDRARAHVSEVFLRGLLQLSHFSAVPHVGRAVEAWRAELRKEFAVEPDKTADKYVDRAARVIRRLLEQYPLTPGQDYEGFAPNRLLYWRDKFEFYHRPEAARLYRLGLIATLKITGRRFDF